MISHDHHDLLLNGTGAGYDASDKDLDDAYYMLTSTTGKTTYSITMIVLYIGFLLKMCVALVKGNAFGDLIGIAQRVATASSRNGETLSNQFFTLLAMHIMLAMMLVTIYSDSDFNIAHLYEVTA
jgi:hypothetical protein